jgi:hypothetical protein
MELNEVSVGVVWVGFKAYAVSFNLLNIIWDRVNLFQVLFAKTITMIRITQNSEFFFVLFECRHRIFLIFSIFNKVISMQYHILNN